MIKVFYEWLLANKELVLNTIPMSLLTSIIVCAFIQAFISITKHTVTAKDCFKFFFHSIYICLAMYWIVCFEENGIWVRLVPAFILFILAIADHLISHRKVGILTTK